MGSLAFQGNQIKSSDNNGRLQKGDRRRVRCLRGHLRIAGLGGLTFLCSVLVA